MARRGRGEIGKVGAPVAKADTSPNSAPTPVAAVKHASQESNLAPLPADPSSSSSDAQKAPLPPPAPSRTAAGGVADAAVGSCGRLGGAGDEEAAAEAFEAALSLCADAGSEVPLSALRALFTAAVQRAGDARKRRDAAEDQCNEVAATNQAVASELAARRTEASRAQDSKMTMEVRCREKAQLHHLAVEHAKAAAAGEEARNAELREKFDTAVPGIREKLQVEAERRRKQREDNDVLRGKLTNFAEQTRLSSESYAAQLRQGSLRLEIAKAKCDQQDAERQSRDARSETLRAELLRGTTSLAKMKAEATGRERCLSKIQVILNDRKKASAALEAKTKELLAKENVLEAECPVWKEAAESEEAMRSLMKMVDRLRSLCNQLEPDVEARRAELPEPEGVTATESAEG